MDGTTGNAIDPADRTETPVSKRFAPNSPTGMRRQARVLAHRHPRHMVKALASSNAVKSQPEVGDKLGLLRKIHGRPGSAGRRTPLRRSGTSPSPVARAWSCLRIQSGASGCLRSHSGLRLRTSGSSAKFCSAGGDAAAHSSVQAFQGSSPAFAPKKRLIATFAQNSRIPNTRIAAPTVEIKIQRAEPRQIRIGVDAPRHPQQSEKMLDEKRGVEAQNDQPKAPAAEFLVQHSSAHFGKPIVNARQQREDRSANQHVVNVRDHEIGIR